MRLQQILNKMKKQEQKIYAIEKAIVKSGKRSEGSEKEMVPPKRAEGTGRKD